MLQEPTTIPTIPSINPLIDTTDNSSDNNNLNSFPLPSFLAFRTIKSQKISNRLNEIMSHAKAEIILLGEARKDDEKISDEVLKNLEDTITHRIKEIEAKIHGDFVLINDALEMLQKFESSLINLIQNSFNNHLLFNDEDEDDEHEIQGIIKKGISKEPKDLQKRKKIPYKAVVVLRQWLFEHVSDPYPSNEVKEELAEKTKLSFKQVHNWFINARGRIWKKMVSQERFGNMVEKLYTQSVTK